MILIDISAGLRIDATMMAIEEAAQTRTEIVRIAKATTTIVNMDGELRATSVEVAAITMTTDNIEIRALQIPGGIDNEDANLRTACLTPATPHRHRHHHLRLVPLDNNTDIDHLYCLGADAGHSPQHYEKYSGPRNFDQWR